jgi:cytochrome bd ubiquinol oxidase subunit II
MLPGKVPALVSRFRDTASKLLAKHDLKAVGYWRPMWDAVFGGSSALLAVFFGAALGNVVRGVPLDASGFFFLPLWTNFDVTGDLGILDWYTVLIGLVAFIVLTLHGALWVALKTEGLIEERCRLVAGRAWWATVAVLALITKVSFHLQPQLGASFSARPWGYVLPALAVAAFAAIRYWIGPANGARAFLASSIFLALMLSSVAFGLYPYVLPARGDLKLGLTVYNAAAGSYGLRIGLGWWIPGIVLAAGYFVFTYRRFAGKVRPHEEGY